MSTWILILTAYTARFEINQIESSPHFQSQSSCLSAGKAWRQAVSEKNGLEFRTHYLCIKA